MDKEAHGRADFARDAKGEVVGCPRGHAPTRTEQRHSDTAPARRSLHVFFDKQHCDPCPDRPRCPVRPPNHKHATEYRLDMAPELVARDDRWAEQKNQDWKTKYRIRAGVEATMSELKRAHGMRRLTVRRLVRVRMQVAFKIIACNLKNAGARRCPPSLSSLSSTNRCSNWRRPVGTSHALCRCMAIHTPGPFPITSSGPLSSHESLVKFSLFEADRLRAFRVEIHQLLIN